MARVRFLSKNRRIGTYAFQREVTGECYREYDVPDELFEPMALRPGDVLAVAHAQALGSFHTREKFMAFLAGREVGVSIGGADPIAVDTPEGRARVHAQAKEPTGHASRKQKANPGRPRKYPDPTDEQRRSLMEWWIGPMHTDDVSEFAGKLLKCKPVPRPTLAEWLGPRPKCKGRHRKTRSDKKQN